MAAQKNIAEPLDHVHHVRKLIPHFEDTKRDYSYGG